MITEELNKKQQEKELAALQERLNRSLATLELEKYGIEEDKEVLLSNLSHLLQDKMPLVEKGVQRNRYWHLRRSMFWTPPSMGGSDLKNPNFEKERGSAVFSLGKEIDLYFEFKMINKGAYDRTYADELRGNRTFFVKNDFAASDAYYRVKNPFKESVKAGLDDSSLADRHVSGKAIKEFLREIMRPEVDVGEAVADLRLLARRLDLNKRQVQDMIYAIGQFATYYKQPPITDYDCFCEIGRCLTQPTDFQFFCKKKFGLEVDNPHYGNSVSSYHEVNEWQGIIIDWTARQYRKFRNKPYPFIYAETDKNKIMGSGELASYKKSKNTR